MVQNDADALAVQKAGVDGLNGPVRWIIAPGPNSCDPHQDPMICIDFKIFRVFLARPPLVMKIHAWGGES